MTKAKPEKYRPPSHLSPEASGWWSEIVAEFALEAHHLRLLQAACEAWDRMQAARVAIAEHGMVCGPVESPKPRPEVAIERDARIAFIRALRELGLDTAAAPDPRPPRPRGY